MRFTTNLLFLALLVVIVSGCTSDTSSQTLSTPNEMTDKIHQSESNYNNAVGDVIELRDDIDGYDLGI